MNTRDFALEIEPDASPERLHSIEQILHRVIAEYQVRARIELERRAYNGERGSYVQAAVIIHELARQHLNQT